MKILTKLAELHEVEQIEALMKRSMKALGVGYYSEEQIESCRQFVCVPDQQLIQDRTFFVAITESGKIVGCGGWSFRNTLYAGPAELPRLHEKLDSTTDPARIRAMFVDPDYSGRGIGSLILELSEQAAQAYGFSRGTLGATLSGLSFYKAKGWKETIEEQAKLPDGVTIGVVQMEKCFKR